MTALQRLKQAREDAVASLAAEQAYEAAHGPRDSYRIGDTAHDWPGWRDAKQREIEAYNRLIQAEQPFTIVSQGRT